MRDPLPGTDIPHELPRSGIVDTDANGKLMPVERVRSKERVHPYERPKEKDKEGMGAKERVENVPVTVIPVPVVQPSQIVSQNEGGPSGQNDQDDKGKGPAPME